MGSLPCVREPGQGEADGFRQMGGTWDSLGKRGRTWVLSGCKCLARSGLALQRLRRLASGEVSLPGD